MGDSALILMKMLNVSESMRTKIYGSPVRLPDSMKTSFVSDTIRPLSRGTGRKI